MGQVQRLHGCLGPWQEARGGPDNATLSRAQPIDAHWGIGRLVGPARGRGLPFHNGGVR